MRAQLFKKTLFTLIALGSWIWGISQQKPDSLASYLKIAAKNNPTVLQRYYEYQAALQKVPQVGSLPDADVSFGVFLSPMEVLGGKQVADIRLMQMFPWFGVLKNAKDEMSLMAKAKYELMRDAQLQVQFNVQQSWYQLYKISQNIRSSERNIEILQTIERLAIVRFKAAPSASSSSSFNKPAAITSAQNSSSGSSGMNAMGATSSSSSILTASAMPGNSMNSTQSSTGLTDVYRVQIEIADIQNNIEQLKTQWNTVAAQFNSYLNRPPEALVTIPDTLIADNFQPSALVFSDSIHNNPMLGMLQYEQQSLEARKQMVTRMSYPMVGFGVNYSVIGKNEMATSSMNGKDMIMPMVTATLPIYRKKYKAMQSEAELLKSANSQNYKASVNQLQTDYYQALQLYLDSQRRVKLYADQHKLASKSLGITTKSYASNGVDLTEVMRIRQQLLDYELKQTEALADYHISIAWLSRIMAISQY